MIKTKDTLKIGDRFIKWVLYFFIRCSQNVINVLSSSISTQQTAYIKNRFIGEGGILVTTDIKTVLDSLDNKFILVVLKNFGLVKTLSPGLKHY